MSYYMVSLSLSQPKFLVLVSPAPLENPSLWKIELEGKNVTITAFSKMVSSALKGAEILAKDGFSAEVKNLRSILPLDRPTINASVRKTNRLVTVEEGFPQHGVGAKIRATVANSWRSTNLESSRKLQLPLNVLGELELLGRNLRNLRWLQGRLELCKL